MLHCIIKTPLGFAKIEGNDDGISSVKISDTTKEISKHIPKELINCVTQLREYFDRKRKTFQLKLNPKGTEFQNKVWHALQNIPYGTTCSYSELSKRLGDIKAIRPVANANGKNPLWIIIPCHRVIGKDGHLTGYAGGLYRKQWLLNHESPYHQPSLF